MGGYDTSNWQSPSTGKYTIDFEWSDREWKFPLMGDLKVTLTMLDAQNNIHEIEHLEPD